MERTARIVRFEIGYQLSLQKCRKVFGKDLLITAATLAGGAKLDISYDIPSLSKNLDFINIMMYDMRGAWNKATGHHATLFEFPEEAAARRAITVVCFRK